MRWLASLVESSDDAIVSKNLNGVITSWNSGAQRIFGYSASEAIGQPITLLIPEDRQSEEREIFTRIRRGERIDHFETVRQRKNGSLIVVSLTVSPVKDASGKIVGASKIARDITEQKRNQDMIVTLDGRPSTAARTYLRTRWQRSIFLSQSRQKVSNRYCWAYPGTCECLLAFRGNTLDRCRAIGDCDTGTRGIQIPEMLGALV